MSYDLWAFPVPSGRDPLEAAMQLLEDQERELEARDPEPQIEAIKRTLADAICSGNPKMTPFALEYERIAEIEKITVEEAKRRYRYIELDGPDDGNGIQVTLYDGYATVTVPYWHQGPKAESVFKEIWGYLRLLSEKGAYVCYDPQLERILRLDSDFDAVVKRYVAVVQQVTGCLSASAKARKPWWKFW
ncbi:MAG TPA: hypothetical protein VFJ30_18290 [Phycisphaerae bacterium]|nr:hypothetical protein [Phycisphaerae bacterium]